MRLICLYVQDNGPYKDMELNFDSNIRFVLKKDGLPPYFVVEKKDVLDVNFFSGTGKTTAVSALIARNGSGKTTAARILHQILSHDEGLGNFLVAFQFEERTIDVYYRLWQKDCAERGWLEECKFPEEVPTGNIELRIDCACPDLSIRSHPLSTEEEGYNSLREKLTMMYCSPLFTTQHPIFFRETNYFRDLSTVGVMRMAHRDLSSAQLELGFRNEIDLGEVEAIETLRAAEIVTALHDHREELKGRNFTLPLGLKVSRNASAIKEVKDYWSSLAKRNNPCITALWKQATSEIGEKHLGESLSHFSVEQFVLATLERDVLNTPCFCVKTFLYYVLLYWRDQKVSYCTKDRYAQEILLIAFRVFLTCQLGEDTLDHQTRLRKLIVTSLQELARRLSANVDDAARALALAKLFNEVKRAHYEDQFFVVPFQDRKGEACMVALIRAYNLVRTQTPFLVFSFDPHVSSGEMAFLTLWGRIKYDYDRLEAKRIQMVANPAKREFDAYGNELPRLDSQIPLNTEHLMVFFDEAESALHPALQKQLIDLSVWFCEKFMPKASCHLIFASHSPILLSDIPKGNVVFLTRDTENRISVACDQRLNAFNTFGANIFDLYRHSFFLECGAVGDFASAKIDEALAELAEVVSARVRQNGPKKTLSRTARLILRNVGDPIIQTYLNSLRDGGLI